MISDVLKYIKEVNNSVDDMYGDVFQVSGEQIMAKEASLEFAKIMKSKYNKAKIFVNKDMSHCCVLVDGILYDALGVINKCDTKDYIEAGIDEIEFMEANVNKLFKDIRIANNVIEKAKSKKESSKVQTRKKLQNQTLKSTADYRKKITNNGFYDLEI